jgi:hypothetical protein
LEIVDGRNRIQNLVDFHSGKQHIDVKDPTDGLTVKCYWENLEIDAQKQFLDGKVHTVVLKGYTLEEKMQIFLNMQKGTSLKSGEKLKAVKWDGYEKLLQSEHVQKFKEILIRKILAHFF